jgi:hypothetical protein
MAGIRAFASCDEAELRKVNGDIEADDEDA